LKFVPGLLKNNTRQKSPDCRANKFLALSQFAKVGRSEKRQVKNLEKNHHQPQANGADRMYEIAG